MDRNTMIGLGLIGVIFAAFTYFNQPSAEDLKKEKERKELAEKTAKKELDKAETKAKKEEVKTETTLSADWQPKLDADKKQVKDQKGGLVFVNKTTGKDTTIVAPATEKVQSVVKGELVRMETDKLIIDFNTKGGVVAAAYLKEYQSYREFKKDKNGKKPLKLFGEEDAVNELKFPINGTDFRTGDKLFHVVKQTKNSIVLELTPEEGQSIQYIYTLKPGAYDLDYEIALKGFDGKVSANNVMFKWNVHMYKSERLLSEQRRVSTVCFKYKGEDYDWLSENANDEEKMEQEVEWVAFKQSYFSTILKPQGGFQKDGSVIKINNFDENAKKYHTHIKKYTSEMNLGLSNTGSANVKMNWFFGPNDYEVLKSYDNGYEDIINYGWGLFRWINIYAIQPLFNFLATTGLGFGMVILLLTLILKLVLTPIQWKMYVSSAKMRILKPEVDALNAKYPKQEDAMKKQMEMMSLYRESGASPLAGCVPMLIQMPILLAVFRFFPAAFELRQQPFLWAEDLSSYDSIYDFGFYIPVYGDHISLFTLLMAITTLVYTHLNSGNMQQPQQPGMPNMKVIMYIFPFMMIFFFNNYSSGLSYYYFISTLMSILIMVAIKQFFVDEDKLKAKMAAKKADASSTTKKKSKFQERLEQMQKVQQERLKNGRK